MKERLNQLESVVALQDNTIHQLHDEMFRQQQDISRLLRRVEALESRIGELDASEGVAGDEKPPHW